MQIHQSRCLFADHAMLTDGWHDQVIIEIDQHGMITGVRADCSLTERNSQPIDWYCRLLLPAISNVHSHAFQRAMAGSSERINNADGSNFWGWREQMYQLANALTPEQVEAISRLAFMEMLEAGFAAVAEFHYLHHAPDGGHYAHIETMSEHIMAAAADSGIGLCLLPVLYSQADADGSDLHPQQRRFANSLDDFQQLLQATSTALTNFLGKDSQLGLAAHSLRAVSPEQLHGLLQQLQAQQPIHIHAAEQTAEIESVQQQLGLRPLEWLLQHVVLDQRWCLIHATHATAAELTALAATGCSIGLCPQTEANLGDGVFALPDWLALRGRCGIGSDANIHISVAAELRLLEYTQRLREQRRQVLQPVADDNVCTSQGEALYRHCLAGGAQALQRSTGSIAPGHWADLLHLDASACGMDQLQADNIIDGWIFAAGAGMVRDVWSAGRHCVRNGQHVQRSQIRARYAAAMRQLQAQR